MDVTKSGEARRIAQALQNGTGVVLSKLALISIPFLLSAIGFLLNSTLDARDKATREAIGAVGQKVDDLGQRVDVLAQAIRETSARAVATEGDLREVQAEQRALERRVDERARR